MSKKISITGISGQVGATLTKELLIRDPNCKIYGFKRRSSSHNTERLDHLFNDPLFKNRIELAYGDLSDYGSILNFVGDVKPDYLYNCAAMSHVKVSEVVPDYCMDIVSTGPVRVLEAIRKTSPKTKFLQLSSSEQFGNSVANPETNKQSELTPFIPESIYACAKVSAYHSTGYYRRAYNMFASNALAFNMEGPLRGPTFLTKKTVNAAVRISLGLQDYLHLGNLNSKRDFNHINDSVDAFIKIMEADKPDDFVVATGISYSIKEFVEMVFSKLGLDWEKYVKHDPKYLRASELNTLCGDASKIKKELNWTPKHTIHDLIDDMINADMKIAKQELLIKNHEK